MPKDARVDAYIAKSADFAKPILKQLRGAVHKAVPRVNETIKWNVPCYEDERGILCLTPAFKRHCAWVFWTGRKPASVDVKALRRIEDADDLPSPRLLVTAVKQAAAGGARKAAARTSKKR